MREKRGMTKGVAVLLCAVGIFVFMVGTLLTGLGVSDIIDSRQDTEEARQWFDPYTEKEEKQLLYFQMLTDSFANYEFNDQRELYFVMDEYSQLYVVCMYREDMQKYQDVYEYTYSDDDGPAPSGKIEGYAVAIDEELKELVIESFNGMMGEELLTEDNFAEYVGNYYLDASYEPGLDEDTRDTVLAGAFFLVAGLALIICTVYFRRRTVREEANRKSIAERAAMVQRMQERQSETCSYTLNGTSYGTYETPKEEYFGNPVLGLIGAVFGAALGGLLWIGFYKIGFIAGISGYAAVFGADWGYRKLSGRELRGPSFALCVILGMLMIVFANYISYVWEIVDVLNESNPGSAAFGTVFRNLPEMMKKYELLGEFVGDLIMGLMFSLFAVISELGARKRRDQG